MLKFLSVDCDFVKLNTNTCVAPILRTFFKIIQLSNSAHYIIQNHNNILWDWQYIIKYSSYLRRIWEYST